MNGKRWNQKQFPVSLNMKVQSFNQNTRQQGSWQDGSMVKKAGLPVQVQTAQSTAVELPIHYLLRTHKATPRKEGLPLAGLWSSWPTLQGWVQGGKRRKENKPWQGIGRQVWKDFHRFGMLSCSRNLKSKLQVIKEKRNLLILIKRRLSFLPPSLPFWTLFLISSFSKK